MKFSIHSIVIQRAFRKIISPWYFIPLIDRWLIGQILPPMLFAISAFTSISLSVGVMFDVIRKMVEFGLPLFSAIKVIIFSLPSFLVLSFPMSVLLSTLLAYGKLSANSELLALKSIGISSSRFIVPAIAISLIMTGLTFYFNDTVVPNSNKLAEAELRSGMGQSFNTVESKDNIMFSRYGSRINTETNKPTNINTYLTHIFYSALFKNNVMRDVTVLDLSRIGYRQVLNAERAIFDKNNSIWNFYSGKIITINPNGTSTSIEFEKYQYSFNEGPLELAKIPKDANDMTVSQAKAAEKLYQETGNVKEVRRMQVRIQEKFTLPFACLVFGIFGSSLGSQSNIRASKSQGFGISIVLILIYYIMSFVFSSFGVKGLLTPFIASWSPVFISLIGGYYLQKRSRI